MRAFAVLLVLHSLVIADERKPFLVTAPTKYVATVSKAAEPAALCITIDGVDWDLDKIRAEYHTPWSWPGNTEKSLRSHLAAEHHIQGLDQLSFDDVRKIHAVIHEREQSALRARSQPIRASPAPRASSCPGGVCPAPNRSRGLFFKWR